MYLEVCVPEHMTDVNIDPKDILDEIDPEDIEEYISKHSPIFDVRSTSRQSDWDYKKMAMAYYHGDFDLKKLLNELKMDNLVSILETKK